MIHIMEHPGVFLAQNGLLEGGLCIGLKTSICTEANCMHLKQISLGYCTILQEFLHLPVILWI